MLLYQRGDEPVNLHLGGSTKNRDAAEFEPEDRRRIVSLSNHCMALDVKGNVFSWGNSGQGRLGVDFTELVPFAVPFGMRSCSYERERCRRCEGQLEEQAKQKKQEKAKVLKIERV